MRRHQRLRPREIKLYVGRVLHVACNESQEGQEVNLWDLTCDEFDISPWDGFIGTQNQGLFVEPKRHDEGHEVVTFFDGFELIGIKEQFVICLYPEVEATVLGNARAL